jgi:hypothetical protein
LLPYGGLVAPYIHAYLITELSVLGAALIVAAVISVRIGAWHWGWR